MPVSGWGYARTLPRPEPERPWLGAIANFVSSIGGALIGRSGQNRGIQAQERATNAQIALERERDAARAERYSTAMADYRRQQAEYDQIRRAMLARYGVNVGAPGGQPDGAKASTQGVSLGGLLTSRPVEMLTPTGAPVAPGAPGPEGPDPSEGEDAFDWRRYGVR